MNLNHLRKHELKALQRDVCTQLRNRYTHHRNPLYGQLNKGFTDEELALFFRHVKNPTPRLVFQLMAGLGLSISEACRLEVADVNLSQRRLWVRSAKGRHPTMFFLTDKLYEALGDHLPHLEVGQRYVFPKVLPSNPLPHISPNAMRAAFRDAVVESGLDFTYAMSTERYEGRQVRRLHRLTTHSLRHFFITKVHSRCHDLVLTQRLARHRNVLTTQRYIYTNQRELDETLVLAMRQ